MEHVDLNGKFPWIVIPLIIGIAVGLTGCENEEEEDVVTYIPNYNCDDYNSDEYIYNTNCYSFAFGMLDNPVTGEKFPDRGNQPGLLSNDEYYLNWINNGDFTSYYLRYLAGTDESNRNLVNVIKSDMNVVGLNFMEYEEGMTGGRRVALLNSPEWGYHFYVYDEITGTWYNKNGTHPAINQIWLGFYIDGNGDLYLSYGDSITDYKTAAGLLGYETIGEYYITRQDGSCFE